jgi:hypothetical protein
MHHPTIIIPVHFQEVLRTSQGPLRPPTPTPHNLKSWTYFRKKMQDPIPFENGLNSVQVSKVWIYLSVLTSPLCLVGLVSLV